MEVWKPVSGYENVYSVSNFGNVRRELPARGAKAGKLIRLQKSGVGYLNANLSFLGIVKTNKVHSLVAEAFIGPRPVGFEVNHLDGVKTNNHDNNLSYVSPGDNIRHAVKTGLFNNGGENHYGAKLTWDDVRSMRKAYAVGKITQKVLATQYSIGADEVSRIINFKRWKKQ